MNSSQLINQDSGNYEYYTPSNIIELARTVMGGIDLDPFSSAVANINVKATKIYTEQQNGLLQKWSGKVWMNHPFSRNMNVLCVQKLVDSFKSGEIEQACCITFAATSEAWFRPLLNYPMCFIHKRTNYFLPSGELKKGVTKGSVVTYLGNDIEMFKYVFSKIGTVKV